MSARCYICDWSPTHRGSLFRADFMSTTGKLFEDERQRTICYECIKASDAVFIGKTIRDVKDDYLIAEEPSSMGLQHDGPLAGTGDEDTGSVQRHDVPYEQV